MTTDLTKMTNESDQPAIGTWIVEPTDRSWEARGETQEQAEEAALAFYVCPLPTGGTAPIDRKEARALLRFDVKLGEVTVRQHTEEA